MKLDLKGRMHLTSSNYSVGVSQSLIIEVQKNCKCYRSITHSSFSNTSCGCLNSNGFYRLIYLNASELALVNVALSELGVALLEEV